MKRLAQNTKVRVRIGSKWVNGRVVRKIDQSDRPPHLRSTRNAYEIAFTGPRGEVVEVDAIVYDGKNIEVRA
jgi:hypothetical protein